MAGENGGSTLKHDDVVRDYAKLPSAKGNQLLNLKIKPRSDEGKPRRLLVVATDPADGHILQAVELGC